MENNIWIDNKGREINILTMSDKWLNNIKKKFPLNTDIREEIKRRKIKRACKLVQINK